MEGMKGKTPVKVVGTPLHCGNEGEKAMKSRPNSSSWKE